MTTVTLNPSTAKPGDTIAVTCAGYSSGESRTVAIRCAGVELTRFTTKSTSARTTIKAPEALPAVIEANGMVGCAQEVTLSPILVPPPGTGIPAIPPATAKTLLHHDFATDGMGPFVGQDYPNVHEADQDPMLGWNPDKTKPRYLTQKFATDAAHISIHDGYLDLLADKQADGSYLAALVATFAKNNAPSRTFQMQYGTITWAAQVLGIGAASWQTPLWTCDLWASPEIDPFEVIGKQWTANLHGSPANGQVWSGPISPGWHIYSLTRTATALQGRIDGVLVWQKAVAMPATMPFLLDSKYGLAFPDATTPASIRAQIAWVVAESL